MHQPLDLSIRMPEDVLRLGHIVDRPGHVTYLRVFTTVPLCSESRSCLTSTT